jgi:4,5-dihydroxyphthalate decarboxylase
VPRLSMTLACGLYDRMLSIYTGEIRPEGVDLNFLAIDNPRELFDRMAGGLEFDAAEMSSSEYISRFAAGECPFVALPVFTSRVFRHGFIAVDGRVIKTPKDLEGKRVGVQLYTMTAAIWIRGLLQDEYGVDLSTIEWVEGAIDRPTPHGSPTVLPLRRQVAIVANDSDESLSDLLEKGKIAATIGSDLPPALGHNPNVRRLFPDIRETEKDYYRRTGIFPIMHLVVLRREFHEQHPFVATSLYSAFCAAKARAIQKMHYLGTLRYMLPWLPADLDEIDEVFGGDPWPYGVEANRKTLETLVGYLADQWLIDTSPPIDDLFVAVHSLET